MPIYFHKLDNALKRANGMYLTVISIKSITMRATIHVMIAWNQLLYKHLIRLQTIYQLFLLSLQFRPKTNHNIKENIYFS